jgi:trimeric autotransporter adhesin
MAIVSRRGQQLILCLSLSLITTLRPFAQERTQRNTGKDIATLTSGNAPVLSSITPAAVALGSGSFVLSIFGSNFLSSSKVLWNGSQRPSTFINSSQLDATISAQDVLLFGSNNVTVSNGTGGVSSPSPVSVYLPLVTNDLIYDSTRGLLWASVPSRAGRNFGNSIVSINPYTGVLGPALWVGSEPTKLSISSDSSTLWVAFAGSPSVQKVDLTALALTPVHMYFPGGWGNNVYASDIATSPGSGSTVAVAAGFVTIFDNAVARPSEGTTGSSYLAFGAAPSTLYGYSGSTLSSYTVGNSGITATKTYSSGSYSNDLRYDKNHLYLTSGQVLDSTTGNLLGTFAASGPVAPDSSLGRAFILNAGQSFGTPNQVTAFDINTFVPLGSVEIGGLDNSFDSPSSLVRWGQDGLAFRADNGVYVVRSSVVKNLSATPADVLVTSLAPTSSTTGANTAVKFTVKNSGPNAASDVSLVGTFSGNSIIVSAVSSQGTCAIGLTVRCDLGQMNNLQSATVSVTVIPIAAGKMTSSALVSASLPDPRVANNHTNSVISVTGLAYNLTPVLSSLSPQSAQLSSGAKTLTVTGYNFVSTSTINWNGTPLPTTFASSTQLSAPVAASLIAKFGSGQVTVSNGAPGGGISRQCRLPFIGR